MFAAAAIIEPNPPPPPPLDEEGSTAAAAAAAASSAITAPRPARFIMLSSAGVDNPDGTEDGVRSTGESMFVKALTAALPPYRDNIAAIAFLSSQQRREGVSGGGGGGGGGGRDLPKVQCSDAGESTQKTAKVPKMPCPACPYSMAAAAQRWSGWRCGLTTS